MGKVGNAIIPRKPQVYLNHKVTYDEPLGLDRHRQWEDKQFLIRKQHAESHQYGIYSPRLIGTSAFPSWHVLKFVITYSFVWASQVAQQ